MDMVLIHIGQQGDQLKNILKLLIHIQQIKS